MVRDNAPCVGGDDIGADRAVATVNAGVVAGVGLCIKGGPQPAAALNDPGTDLGCVFAHATGKDQGIDTLGRALQRAGLLAGAIDKKIHRRLSGGAIALQQIAHVIAETRGTEQPRLPTKQSLDLL